VATFKVVIIFTVREVNMDTMGIGQPPKIQITKKSTYQKVNQWPAL